MKNAQLEQIQQREREKKRLKGELRAARRERDRLNNRRAYLRGRNAPKDMLARYDLDIKSCNDEINRLHEAIFALEHNEG